MKHIVFVAVCCLLLQVTAAVADDTDALLSGAAAGRTLVHVVMDAGDTDRDPALCTYGLDCAPPFTSDAVYAHLGDMYADGEVVTAPGMFRAVLVAVLDIPLFDDLYLALIVPNLQDKDAVERDRGGGTILSGYQRLGDAREAFIQTLKSVPSVAAGSAHALQPRESYFEWLRYIRGSDVVLGDLTRGNFGLAEPSPDFDSSIIQAGQYQSPLDDAQECPAFYSILFLQGRAQSDDDLDREIAAELDSQVGRGFSSMLVQLHGPAADLVPSLDNTVGLRRTWVVSSRASPGDAGDYARAGGGDVPLYIDDPVELQGQLTRSLAAMMEFGGSLAAPAFFGSESDGTRQMFLPMYRAQRNHNWPGNLKKLSLAGSAEHALVQALDAQGKPAFESAGNNRGRLRAGALTRWTDPEALPDYASMILPAAADGPLVDLGGAGQKVDGFVSYHAGDTGPVGYFIGDTNTAEPRGDYPSRQVFYQSPGTTTLLPFDASASALPDLRPLLDPAKTKSDEELLQLIRLDRGQGAQAGEAGSRSWILGALLHSTPLVLNYGATSGYSASNPNIRLFFGTTRGMFHILENTDIAGNESGREVFAFYPAESLVEAGVLRQGAARKYMRYGVDGEPVALTRDNNGDGVLDYRAGDEAIVFFGLRRGGRSYYALDVSNPQLPPVMLWEINSRSGKGFPELGLTFSKPVVGKINYNGTPVDVLVFSGGYNGGWNESLTGRVGKDKGAANDESGNAIYIVNARTGELIWKAVEGTTGVSSNIHYEHAALVDSIPSKVSVLRSSAGVIHRLYVGDTGGALWRVDLPQATSAAANHRRDHWFITKLADLGADVGEPGGEASEDRRFFHAADIVRSFDSVGEFDGVLIQSGNRAAPNALGVKNYLFHIKDREIISGSSLVRAENEANTPGGRFEIDDLADRSECASGAQVSGNGDGSGLCGNNLENGWKLYYQQPGEKGLSAPLVDGGRVFTTTYTPGDMTACPRQSGAGHAYAVRLADGAALANLRRRYKLGSEIPSPPVLAGDVIYFSGEGIDLYDLDGDGVAESTKFLPSQATRLYGVYWREPGMDPL